jgi:hypothetical protein
MLTPAQCVAGRWQPFHLIDEQGGKQVDLTFLVRDTPGIAAGMLYSYIQFKYAASYSHCKAYQ